MPEESLDAQVARKLGCNLEHCVAVNKSAPACVNGTLKHGDIPAYSTDMNAAMELVRDRRFILSHRKGCWTCTMEHPIQPDWMIEESADTPSLAIVRAFLALPEAK